MQPASDPIDPEYLAGKIRKFADFSQVDEPVILDLLQVAIYKKLPAGLVTSTQGADCQHFPIVLGGSARVFTVGDNGKELTLYRLIPGGACVLAASSILGDQPLAAYSVTEAPGEVLMVPALIFRQWIDQSDFWRSYVFGLISKRLASVISVTNQTAFSRLDTRISNYLLDAAKDGDQVTATHQAIAMDIGSSREVVSRILKSFEVEGMLKLARGKIHLLDRQGLIARGQVA